MYLIWAEVQKNTIYKMKHLDSINELFGIGDPNEGDDFASRLLDIVEKEKVRIIKCPNRYGYIFEVDGVHYEIEEHIRGMVIPPSYFTLKYYEGDPNIVNTYEVKISRKLYKRIEHLYKEYEKYDRLRNLPDISEEGRTAKKYNL